MNADRLRQMRIPLTFRVNPLKSINENSLNVGLPLAASGIRGIRFLLELGKRKVDSVSFNDNMADFKRKLNANLKLNKVASDKRRYPIPGCAL